MPQPFKRDDHHHVQQATTTRNWIPSGDVVRRGDQPRERSMFGENNIRRSRSVSAAPPFQQVPSFRQQDPSARRRERRASKEVPATQNNCGGRENAFATQRLPPTPTVARPDVARRIGGGQSEQFRSTAARLVSLRKISLVRLACQHQVADCD